MQAWSSFCATGVEFKSKAPSHSGQISFWSELIPQALPCKGDVEAAKNRLEIISDLPILELNDEIINLANSFIQSGVFPQNYVEDALHISIATIHGMDYLLTWNCKHIANAKIRTEIERLCRENGYINPTICTPEELMGA